MALANVIDLRFWRWPVQDEGEVVEFRLIYRGSLPASNSGNSSLEDKHKIRQQMHRQLRELWRTHVVLERLTRPISNTRKLIVPDLRDDEPQQATGLDLILRNYSKFNYRFVPLINKNLGIACSLDILFLRRDGPGNLIMSAPNSGGGDIDNRIKVLFDALRIPQYNNEIDKFPPQPDENPFYCLLEDDSLITDVKITTDRLLSPLENDEHRHDVHLVLHVTTKILDPQKAWPDFAF